jgi:hypothetical protein
MNPFEFVIVVLIILGVFQILRHRMGIPSRRDRLNSPDPAASDAEARALREEVRQLKERVQVLERITVEKENSLSRQIEELRDRP